MLRKGKIIDNKKKVIEWSVLDIKFWILSPLFRYSFISLDIYFWVYGKNFNLYWIYLNFKMFYISTICFSECDICMCVHICVMMSHYISVYVCVCLHYAFFWITLHHNFEINSPPEPVALWFSQTTKQVNASALPVSASSVVGLQGNTTYLSKRVLRIWQRWTCQVSPSPSKPSPENI